MSRPGLNINRRAANGSTACSPSEWKCCATPTLIIYPVSQCDSDESLLCNIFLSPSCYVTQRYTQTMVPATPDPSTPGTAAHHLKRRRPSSPPPPPSCASWAPSSCRRCEVLCVPPHSAPPGSCAGAPRNTPPLET